MATGYAGVFRNGAFDALPVSAQSEILRDRIRRIVVRDGGVHVEYFCEKSKSAPVVLGGNSSVNVGREGGLKSLSSTSGVRTVFKMVSQPECGTNTRYLVDFIRICLTVKLLDSEEIRELYENKLLSAAQIGKHFRVSRVTILSHLHEMGIRDRPSVERATNPENYRMRVAPYGYAIQNGKLVSNKTELKICRLVVELVQRHGRRHTDVARELSKRGFKNRAGRKEWNSGTVFNIYKRWKDKL